MPKGRMKDRDHPFFIKKWMPGARKNRKGKKKARLSSIFHAKMGTKNMIDHRARIYVQNSTFHANFGL